MTTAIQQRMCTVKELLERVKPQIQQVAPKHLTADRILRIAMTSIQRTPKLAECTPESLLGSVLTCTQLGLEPDAASGKAYLIPYGKVCTLIIGYKGLMELARRSGKLGPIEARVVYENDMFEYEYGTASRCVHKPCMNGEAGRMVAVYAVAKFKDGEPQFEVMTREQVEGIRKRSKASKDGPWVTDYDEMARKTAVRRLCKYLPSSPELSTALALDDAADAGMPQGLEVIDVSIADNTSRAGKLASRVVEDTSAIGTDSPGALPAMPLAGPPPDINPKAKEQVERMNAVAAKRKSIRDAFEALKSDDTRARALKNVKLGDIGEIEMIGDMDELDSIRDGIMSA